MSFLAFVALFKLYYWKGEFSTISKKLRKRDRQKSFFLKKEMLLLIIYTDVGIPIFWFEGISRL